MGHPPRAEPLAPLAPFPGGSQLRLPESVINIGYLCTCTKGAKGAKNSTYTEWHPWCAAVSLRPTVDGQARQRILVALQEAKRPLSPS